ncbi:hypothetical protein FKV42_02535 [Methanolobus vulcani]|uniref:CheW-like domain-containing protein n=2 Tax=Methanolobus vulcani TaxID=38026 RepID=A0A7Z8KSC4_9EURY|nr:hypothetical protein FKV42_02535 [Methanolobus vulcani]
MDIMNVKEIIHIPEPFRILQSPCACVGKLDDCLLLLIDSRKILGKDEQLSIINSGYRDLF